MGFAWVAPGEAGPRLARLVRDVAAGRRPARGILPRDPPRALDRYFPWPRSVRLRCPIEITRGCPVGCAFCQTPRLAGRRPRHRSLQSIGEVFEQAVASGNTFTRFIAPNAFAYGSRDGRTPQPRAVERLLALARDKGMKRVYLGTFPAEVRPDSVTDELLTLVRDHCDNRSIVVGLQSGSPEVLRRLRRGHTVAQGIEAVARIARAGFRPAVDFIFGLPGEGDHDRRLTRELVRQLNASYDARINLHLFTPLPGTPLARTRPAPLDHATRDLLDEIAGRGEAWGHVAGWDRPRPLANDAAS
jgi:B12-binding domain/radical SAM domain protein